jgi:hypothetical protein
MFLLKGYLTLICQAHPSTEDFFRPSSWRISEIQFEGGDQRGETQLFRFSVSLAEISSLLFWEHKT